jgi:hypothetical protein
MGRNALCRTGKIKVSKYVFNSELMEPFAVYMLGIASMKLKEDVDAYKKNAQPHSIVWYTLANRIIKMWYTVDMLNKISCITEGECAHYNVAMSNEARRTAQYLKKICGVCPIQEKDRFNARDFDFKGLV